MTVDDEIKQAFEDLETDRRIATKKLLADAWYSHDKRLNDPVWLIDQLTTKQQTEANIAKLIGCSEWLVHEKAKNVFQLPDKIFDVYTGFFHSIKWLIYPLLKQPIKKIQQGIDSVYGKTKSRNAGIFKDIILEMETLDDDTGDGNFIMHHVLQLGLSRKQLYILILKFMVCLYNYDAHYAERGDYFIKRILERQSEIYLDDVAKPENWHPHRNNKLMIQYMMLRNQK